MFPEASESSLLGAGTLFPEKQADPAEFCRPTSPAHFRSNACRRKQGHAVRESQGGGVDPSRIAGSLENAVRPLNYYV